MQRWNSDPEPWYIVPVKPGAEVSFRRWNFAIISILAALVLAMFVAVIVPQAPGSTSHQAPGSAAHQASKVHHVS